MRDNSEKKGQMTAAITAQYRRDQMAGHFVDKKEINHIGLDGMNREQLEKRLENLKVKSERRKTLLTSRQLRLLKKNNWNSFIQVFNEVHNSTMTTMVGSVYVKTKNNNKQKG
jgi:hypothetical protein